MRSKAPLPRRPKPTYTRTPAQKVIDKLPQAANEAGKAIRRIPKDIAEGGKKLIDQGGRAVKNVAESVRKIKRSTR